MTQKVWWGRVVILLILLLLPLTTQAQTSPQFQELSIEVWPEFDRPETLIIYRATLSADTALPTELTFQLPGYIESMHAVAVQQNGSLVDVPTEVTSMRREGDNLFLTFTTPAPNVQFEYYDPVILSQNRQARALAYTVTAPYNAATVLVQVQQPAQATNFSLNPPADNSFVGRDGLTYHNIRRSNLAAGETFDLAAEYSRPTDELSVTQITLNPPAPAQGNPVAPTTISTAPTINWGYVMVGAGVVLLLIGGGYWWWLQGPTDSVPPRRPARSSRSRRSLANDEGGYCYRCGAALRADAQFCHQCGAERRR
jgi:hypothetical protein